MLYLASSPESADVTDSDEVTPSLAQPVQDTRKSPVVKEIACNTELRRKPDVVVARVQSFDCQMLKFHAVYVSLWSAHLSTRYAQVV